MKFLTKLKIFGILIMVIFLSTLSIFFYMFNYHVIYNVPIKDKKIALTFDDGPDQRFTPEVLDILKKYNAKATFFVVGKQVENLPEITKRIVAEGNELGDHTYSHPNLLKMNKSEINEEIDRGKRIIERISGKNVKWFRPPKMLYGPLTNLVVSQDNMEMVLWKIGIENHNAKTPKAMADRVAAKVKPGWIILLHDGRLDRTKTVEALSLLLDKLQKEGYKFVTISELKSEAKV